MITGSARVNGYPPQITRVTKAGRDSLTKKIILVDGKPKADSSDCWVAKGRAERLTVATATAFVDVIRACDHNQAFALGRYADELADKVALNTVAKRRDGEIARARAFIDYQPGRPGWALVDSDLKGAPPAVLARLEDLGGIWPAIQSMAPGLASAARVRRKSTSAGLYDPVTGDDFSSSGGEHNYLLLDDGGDAQRFLETLHATCWLHGLGWHIVGDAGQVLERSIVDQCVWGGERLCFEAKPHLIGLAQDITDREPEAFDGRHIATSHYALTDRDRQKIAVARDASHAGVAPIAKPVRDARVRKQAEAIVTRDGGNIDEVIRRVDAGYRGILDSARTFKFDDGREVTGVEILADPQRFVGLTLADPIEPEYGRCKCRVMGLDARGDVVFHSYAHGPHTYKLGPFSNVDIEPPIYITPQSGKMDMADWAGRIDIRKPEPLLGNVFCAAGRGFISGPTGVGKSNLLYGVAASIATGEDYLHWKGSGKPCNVLIIDGEMARDLLQERVRDVLRRHPRCAHTLHLISNEDIDLSMLNTPEGMKFVLDKIAEWQISAVFLDNVQSLVDGDMREETSWKAVQPLVNELTKRRILQVWIDHTGHDESHTYGSSTKLWKLDWAIMLSKATLNDSDLAISVEFTKARRRTKATWSEFASGTIRLKADEWSWTEGQSGKRKGVGVPKQLQVAYDCFRAACVLDGSIGSCQRRTMQDVCLERSVTTEGSFKMLVSRMVAEKLIRAEQKGKVLFDCRPLEPVEC